MVVDNFNSVLAIIWCLSVKEWKMGLNIFMLIVKQNIYDIIINTFMLFLWLAVSFEIKLKNNIKQNPRGCVYNFLL